MVSQLLSMLAAVGNSWLSFTHISTASSLSHMGQRAGTAVLCIVGVQFSTPRFGTSDSPKVPNPTSSTSLALKFPGTALPSVRGALVQLPRVFSDGCRDVGDFHRCADAGS